jgi:hypothetical protein
MKKELVLESVKNSASSIFSKEDVIKLINSIEKSNSISSLDLGRAIDKVISWVENNERDFLDLDSAELEIDYNHRIEVVGVPVNVESLREALENNFSDFAQEEDDDLFVGEDEQFAADL